jgi:hypothetical protein
VYRKEEEKMTTRPKKEIRTMGAEARALARKWQKRLGMGDWDIEVRIERDLNGALGDALVLNPEARWAQIAIAADCPADQLEPTVVHELIEILLARLSEIALSGMREAHFNRWELEKERLVEFATHRLLAAGR